MTSKLDPQRKARDHRRNDHERKKRKRHHEKPKTPLHVDATSIVFASQQPDAESRYIFLEVLPDMTEEWIDKIVFLRSPTTGTPDRSFLGIQNLDDTLVWIELSLASAPAAGSSPPDPGEATVATWVRNFGASSLSSMAYNNRSGIDINAAGTHLWVADPGADRLAKFSIATGAFVSATSGTAPTNPQGVICHPTSGLIYTADKLNTTGGGTSRLKVYTESTGAFSATIRQTTQWEGDGEILEGIALKPDGLTIAVCVPRSHDHAADPTVEQGELHQVVISSNALTRYQDTPYYPYPAGADYDSSGNMYVVGPGGSTNNTDAHRLTKVVVATGATVNSIGGFAGTASGKFNDPSGCRVDRTNGRVFVTDRTNGRVQIFDTNLNYLGKFGDYDATNDPGKMFNPSGMVLVGTSLYVVNNGNLGGFGIAPFISEWTITL